MPRYSIITPMYKSFDLMERYFASIEHQTYKDFEVIIIDDCSPDDSYERAKEYAEKSSLSIFVYQTVVNGGPGNSRNIGIDKAKGEWITFIDNDDWVEITLLEKVQSVLAEQDVGCVIYDYYIQNENEKRVSSSMYTGSAGIVPLSECMIYARNHTIGKFYKLTDCRKHNIRFPNLRRCEDVAFVARAIDACGSAYYLNEPLYYYYQRQTSLSNNKSMDETDMLKAFSILEETLGGKYTQELKEKSVTDLLYGVVLMMCKSGKSRKEIKSYISNYEVKYPDWKNCRIINHIGSSKKMFLRIVQLKAVGALKVLAWLHSKMIG